MQVFAIDNTNINDFSFLFRDTAVEKILNDSEMSAFVVKKDDAHVGGLAGHFTSQGQYEVESIYVLPDYRRQGVGSFMLNTLYELLRGMEAHVNFHFIKFSDEFNGLAEFLDSMGYDEYLEEKRRVYITNVEKISSLKIASTTNKAHYTSFAAIPAHMFKEFATNSKGFAPLPNGGFQADSIDKDVSFGYINNEKLSGYVIGEKLDENTIMLTSIYITKNASMVVLTGLLGQAITACKEKYAPEVRLVIPSVTNEAGKLIESLFTEEEADEISANYSIIAPGGNELNYNRASISEILSAEQINLYSEEEGTETEYLTKEEYTIFDV